MDLTLLEFEIAINRWFFFQKIVKPGNILSTAKRALKAKTSFWDKEFTMVCCVLRTNINLLDPRWLYPNILRQSNLCAGIMTQGTMV